MESPCPNLPHALRQIPLASIVSAACKAYSDVFRAGKLGRRQQFSQNFSERDRERPPGIVQSSATSYSLIKCSKRNAVSEKSAVMRRRDHPYAEPDEADEAVSAERRGHGVLAKTITARLKNTRK